MTIQSPYSVPPHDQRAVDSHQLLLREEQRVKSALHENRIDLFYQPVVRSDSGKFVAFHEALARIHMPDGTVISAGQFMPFIDNTGLGSAVDLATLKLALEMLDAQRDLRLSVNLSALTMSNMHWMQRLESHDKSVRERLIIEITETGAMSNVDFTSGFFDKVHALGVSIAIDDFGTGSTSFRYFRQFKFDLLKIDGMFIRDIAQNKDYQVLVEALVKICQQFDMFTVAEFIETEDDAYVAQQAGIDCFQGYLIGKPTQSPTIIEHGWSDNRQMTG